LSLAPDPVNGFGGDLGGLSGADEICATLAQNSNPGDAKVWRAFLSTSGYDGAEQVDAIDRIGDGPWYDYQGRLFAESLDSLIPTTDGRCPGDPQLAEMYTDEWGDPIRPNEQVDNHDTLTGSNTEGRLYDDGNGGEIATCRDWTSNTVSIMDAANSGGGGRSRGIVPVGHSWPRSSSNGREWIQDHTVNGCEPSVNIGLGAGAAPDDYSVGGGGGYGAFYCFALDAVAPE